jgi:hypothetical protein
VLRCYSFVLRDHPILELYFVHLFNVSNMVRKYLVLFLLMVPFLLKSQIYFADNGLTVTGTGVNKRVRLGGPLVVNASFDLGSSSTYSIVK